MPALQMTRDLLHTAARNIAKTNQDREVDDEEADEAARAALMHVNRDCPIWETQAGGVATDGQRTFAVPSDWSGEHIGKAYLETPEGSGILTELIYSAGVLESASALEDAATYGIRYTKLHTVQDLVTPTSDGTDATSIPPQIWPAYEIKTAAYVADKLAARHNRTNETSLDGDIASRAAKKSGAELRAERLHCEYFRMLGLPCPGETGFGQGRSTSDAAAEAARGENQSAYMSGRTIGAPCSYLFAGYGDGRGGYVVSGDDD